APPPRAAASACAAPPRAASRTRSAASRRCRRLRLRVRSRLPTRQAWALPAGSHPHGALRRSGAFAPARALKERRAVFVSAQVRRSREAVDAREIEGAVGFKGACFDRLEESHVQAKRTFSDLQAYRAGPSSCNAPPRAASTASWSKPRRASRAAVFAVR